MAGWLALGRLFVEVMSQPGELSGVPRKGRRPSGVPVVFTGVYSSQLSTSQFCKSAHPRGSRRVSTSPKPFSQSGRSYSVSAGGRGAGLKSLSQFGRGLKPGVCKRRVRAAKVRCAPDNSCLTLVVLACHTEWKVATQGVLVPDNRTSVVAWNGEQGDFPLLLGLF